MIMHTLSVCNRISTTSWFFITTNEDRLQRTLATNSNFPLNYASPATAGSTPLASSSGTSLFKISLSLSHQIRFFHLGFSLTIQVWFGFLTMASLRPTLSQLSLSQSNFPRKSTWNNPPHCFFHKRIAKFHTFTHSKSSTSFKVCCTSKDTKNQNNGEEPPESLFMKELKRRGMTPTSLLEDYKQSNNGLDEEIFVNEEDRGGFSNRKAVSTDVERGLENQRERSMALNSEGLEGLVPRAKLLVTLGGTFFLAFGPLILITVAIFSALYFYFGSAFVHDGSEMSLSPPPYVDPYELLEDERISQITARLN